MLPVLAALAPALYAGGALVARRRAPGTAGLLFVFGALAAGAAAVTAVADWRMALTAFGPLTLVVALVAVNRSAWPEAPSRTLQLNAMWAAFRVLALAIPFGAGVFLWLGVPRGFEVVADRGLNWPTVTLGFASFLLADLVNYFTHRARHRITVMWRFHEIHHSDSELNPLTTRRQHIVDHLIARTGRILPFIVIGPLYLMGFLPWAVIRGAAGYYHHSATNFELGPLSWVITTPACHRMHHSTRPEHFDCNFGAVLIIWDRIFGTYVAPSEDLVPTGVTGTTLVNEIDDDRPLVQVFWAQLVSPFLAIVANRRVLALRARGAAPA